LVALGGRCPGGVAEDAVAADRADAAGGEVRHELRERPRVARRGGAEPHVGGGERQHDRRLEPARVRVRRHVGRGRWQARVPDVALQALGPQLRYGGPDRGNIPAVAVDQQRRGPVQAGVPAEFDQQCRQSDSSDRQRAGEVRVLAARADRDRRGEANAGAGKAGARPGRDRGRDPRVGVEREVRSVLF
jgi:hypothetical protein